METCPRSTELKCNLVFLLRTLPLHCCRVPSLQHALHFPTSFLRKGLCLSKMLNTALCYANVAHATLSYCSSCHSPRCLSHWLWDMQPNVPVAPECSVSACWPVPGLWLQIPKDPKDLQFPQVQFVLQKWLCMSVPPICHLGNGKMNAEPPHGRLGSLLNFYVTYYKNPK